jgi:hypothetical protein
MRALFPTFLPTFVVVCFLDDSHSDWGDMQSWYLHFDLHFPYG